VYQDANDGETITEFERERLANIARNERALKALVNKAAAESAREGWAARPATRQKTRPRREVEAAAAALEEARVPPLEGEIDDWRKVEASLKALAARMEEDRTRTAAARKRARMAASREKANERRRAWRADPERKEKDKKRRRAWRADPELKEKENKRRRARRAANPELKEEEKERQRARRADPALKEKENKRRRARMAANPELREKEKERQRARRADPELKEKENERRRRA